MRPITVKIGLLFKGAGCRFPAPNTANCGGTTMLGCDPTFTPVNPAGITPTTLTGTELRFIRRQTMFGSELNCVCQNSWLITAVHPPAPLPGESSAGVSNRPSTGF